MAKFSVTLSIPTDIRMTVGKDGALFNELDLTKLTPELLAIAVVNGFTSAWSDISRPMDENGKKLDDAAWQAARDKRSAAWLAGNWNQVGSGKPQSMLTQMKEQYIDERRAATGMTRAAIETAMKGAVTAVFGKESKFTFQTFLEAVATLKAKETGADYGETFDTLYGELETRTIEAIAQSAKAVAAIEVDVSSLGF